MTKENESAVSGIATVDLVNELAVRLEEAGTSGDGGELAAHVMGDMAAYFSTEALLTVLRERAGHDDASLLSDAPTRGLCNELRRRITAKKSSDPDAGETVTEVLAEHITLTDEQLIAAFKANGDVTVAHVFPKELNALEARADEVGDVLNGVAALVFDLDMSQIDTLRHKLMGMGVYGHHSPQVFRAGDLTADLGL